MGMVQHDHAVSFAPKITLPNGQEYTPEGWMWILAFALRGIPWAITEASKPEFDAKIKDWYTRKQIAMLEEEREELQAQLNVVQQQLQSLKDKQVFFNPALGEPHGE